MTDRTAAFSDEERKQAADLIAEMRGREASFTDAPGKEEDVWKAVRRTEEMITRNRKKTEYGMDIWVTDALKGAANLLTVGVSPTSGRRLLGPVITFIRRAALNMVMWYLRPVMERQSWFNQSMLERTDELKRMIVEKEKDTEK